MAEPTSADKKAGSGMPPTRAGRPLLLLAAAVLPFLPSLSGGPLWDDDHYVFANPVVHNSRTGLIEAWQGRHLMDYYPVTHSLFWLEWQAFGDRPLGFRIVSCGLHAIGSLLVWHLLRQFQLPGAFLAAVVWATHPVQVDAVCWISQQKSLLSALLATGAVLAYGRYRQTPAPSCGRWYATALGLHALACLSKTDAVMLPGVLLLLETFGWFGEADRSCWSWKQAKTAMPRMLPFFAISAAAGVLAIVFMNSRVVTSPIDLGSPSNRLLKAVWAYSFYWLDFLTPFNLAAVYPEPVLPRDAVIAATVLTAGTGLLLWLLPRQRAGVLLVGLLVGCLLLPVLYIAPQGFYKCSPVADRYLRLPLVVMAAGTVAAGTGLVPRRWHALAGLVTIGVLASLTWFHATDYRSETLMWRAAIRNQPEAWYPHYGLAGRLLFDDGDPDGAAAEAAIALEGNADFPPLLLVAGLAAAGREDFAAAEQHLSRAIAVEPAFEVARQALAEVHRRKRLQMPNNSRR